MLKQANIRYRTDTTLGKNFEALKRVAKIEGTPMNRKILEAVSVYVKGQVAQAEELS